MSVNVADLYALASRAAEDDAVLPVLGDFVLESGWFDAHVMRLLDDEHAGYLAHFAEESRLGPGSEAAFADFYVRFGSGGQASAKRGRYHWWKLGHPRLFKRAAAAPTVEWARAIVAVILFGGWPETSTWGWSQRPVPRVVTLYGNGEVTIDGQRIATGLRVPREGLGPGRTVEVTVENVVPGSDFEWPLLDYASSGDR